MSTFLLMLLTAIRNTINYCTSSKWGPVVETVPAFSLDIQALKDKVKKIDGLISQYEEQVTGYTEMLSSLRTTLEEVAFTQITRGLAYSKKADPVLFKTLAQAKTLSKIQRMKQSDLGQKMQAYYNGLSKVTISKLTPYGITAASLQNWADALKAYNDFLSTPRTEKVDRNAINKAIKECITDANDFMRTEVVFHARGFIQSNKDFYNGFEDSLRQIPVSDRHTRLLATLIDEEGNTYPYCQVSVDAFTDPETRKTYKAYYGYTNEDGQCTISGFQPGVRSVTISGDAIETKTFSSLRFVRAKAIERTFICTPAFRNIPSSQSNKEKTK